MCNPVLGCSKVGGVAKIWFFFFLLKIYFTIRRTDNISNKSFKEFSLAFISKTFQSVFGDVCLLKRLHSDHLLVEVSSANQLQVRTDSSAIDSFFISVQVHPTKNSIRGVISEPEQLYSTKDEILENRKDKGIWCLLNIYIRQNEQVLPTKHIILAFNSPTLPARIKAEYLSCPVRHYIPTP